MKKIIIEDLEDLAILEEPKEQEEAEIVESDEENVEITKPIKKPRSVKQIEAFKQILILRDEKRKTRSDDKKIKELEEKQILEAKIIKKAITLKKKQIKKQIALDEISDDDEDIEILKQKIAKSNLKKVMKTTKQYIGVSQLLALSLFSLPFSS